jgi:hypothetical protein
MRFRWQWELRERQLESKLEDARLREVQLQWGLGEARIHNQKLVESNEVLKDDVRELQEKLAEANANIKVLSEESEPLSRRAEDIMGINPPFPFPPSGLPDQAGSRNYREGRTA